MTAAGILVAIGALFMVTKGVIRATTGADPSLVPFFSGFAGAGLTAAAAALGSTARRLRWLCATAGALAAGGTAAAVVAIAYLVTGTIPETAGASPVVGGSYAAMSIGVFGSLVALGVVVAVNRALAGWWRWLPLGLIAAQFPIFAIADAAGEVSRSDVVADGLGLALTGAAWMILGYPFTRARLAAGQHLSPDGIHVPAPPSSEAPTAP